MRLTNITVAPLTRTQRSIPSEVELTPADGVPTPCAISLENIQTIRRVRLDRKITRLPRLLQDRVFTAIRFVFGMPEKKPRG